MITVSELKTIKVGTIVEGVAKGIWTDENRTKQTDFCHFEGVVVEIDSVWVKVAATKLLEVKVNNPEMKKKGLHPGPSVVDGKTPTMELNKNFPQYEFSLV